MKDERARGRYIHQHGEGQEDRQQHNRVLGVLPEMVDAFTELFDGPFNDIACLSHGFGALTGSLCRVLGVLMLDSLLLLGFAADRRLVNSLRIASMLSELPGSMAASLQHPFRCFLSALGGFKGNIVVLIFFRDGAMKLCPSDFVGSVDQFGRFMAAHILGVAQSG